MLNKFACALLASASISLGGINWGPSGIGEDSLGGSAFYTPSTSNLYFMSSFRSTDSPEKLLFYIGNSERGPWVPIGDSFYTAPSGGVRDPGFFYDAAHGQYYIAYTAGIFGSANYIQIIRSSDLETWVPYTQISTASLGSITYSWVNGFYVEGDNIYALLSVSNDGYASMKGYLSQSTISGTLATWTAPSLITNSSSFPTFMISQNIVKISGTYNFVYKNDVTKANELAKSTSVGGPYSFSSTVGPTGYEGFTIALTGTGAYSNSGTYTAITDKYSMGGIYYQTSGSGFTWTATSSIMDTTFGAVSNPFVWKVSDTKMANDVFNLSSRHSARAAGLAGYYKPANASVLTPGFWNQKVGICYDLRSGYEAMAQYINCTYVDGSGYLCIDTTKPAWVILTGFGTNSDKFEIYRGPATAGSIAFTLFFSLSNSGALNLGNGGISLTSLGKTLSIKSGANALAGTVTLTAGSGSVVSTAITTSTVIQTSMSTASGASGPLQVRVYSGSATFTGLGTDAGTYNWIGMTVN